MSFKSRKPPAAPQLPPQPTAPELMDFIDEIGRTETITATGADGKKRRISRPLRRTPEEEAMFKKSQELMATAVRNIEELYKYDPTTVANYQPFIQAFSQINHERSGDLARIGDFGDIASKIEGFKKLNRELVHKEFDKRERMREEILAKRGLARSTMAAEERAAFAGERALAEQHADVNANLYGEDLMSRQLSREQQAYNLREAGRQGRLTEAQMAYELERQKQGDLEALRQGAIAENRNFLEVGRGIQGDERQKSQLALQYGAAAQDLAHKQAVEQGQRYDRDKGRVMDQYRLDLNNFQNQPVRFGDRAMDLGFGVVSQNATSGLSSLMPGFGAPMGGSTSSTSSQPSTQSDNRRRSHLSLGGP